ncbi:MAG: 1-deoxy-D-xylulose-5-phosphate reductoisomerase [Bacillota bacterium]
MSKTLVVLGSTGSIGTQALEVVEWLGGGIKVAGLAAGGNIDLLEKQVRRHQPRVVAVAHEGAARTFRERVRDLPVDVLSGEDAAAQVAAYPEADLVLSAVVGIAGFVPTLAAVRAGKTVALANKETLVAAGKIVTEEARRRGTPILPVDSEHSAIFQCLQGHDMSGVERLILTASGGPFRTLTLDELRLVRPEEALRHPNWAMGAKITVDSATLMNKALEVIEARWLFGIAPDKIDIVVHPQSIVHSMVEFLDGSVLAQLGVPDMRLPIQYALTYPSRVRGHAPRLDPKELGALTFELPDTRRFPAVRLGHEALRVGGTMPCVLSAANEEAVKLFLARRIGFCDIAAAVEDAMAGHDPVETPDPEDILAADRWARKYVARWAERRGGSPCG